MSAVSTRSIRAALLAIPLCAAFVVTTTATKTQADPLAGGIAGAIGGAIIGGAIKGKKGAGRGALIGLGVGVAAGIAEDERRKRHRAYKRRHHSGPYSRRVPANAVPYAPAYDSELVYETQLELERLGYNPGPVDGVYGPQTADALATYQDDYALPVTGEPDPGLLDHMRRHDG